MFTTGSKFFFGLTIFSLIAYVVYGFGSRGGFLGVLSVGLRGGVGEHAGLIMWLFLAGASLLLGVIIVAFRDADPDALAAVARSEALPEATPRAQVSYWPIVAAFCVALVLLGLVVSSVLFVIGLFGAGIVMVEWMVQTWSERATGDPHVNRQIRNRLMFPLEIPLAGALAILVVVVAVSRVLLALSKSGSAVIAIVVSLVILGVASLIAIRPQISRALVAAALVVGAVSVITGGIIAAATGEREFHHHEEDEEQGGEEEGLGANSEVSLGAVAGMVR